MWDGRLVVVSTSGDVVPVWVHEVALDAGRAEMMEHAGLLSREERARAARFRFAIDRRRFVVGRAMLRRILAGHGAGSAERLIFLDGPWGKPALSPLSSLRFNVAHSGPRALVAVARGRDVGIDVEHLRPLADVIAVARRVCTAAEWLKLARLPSEDRDVAFRRCWVRKEACAKALGVGLHQPFETFEVDLAGPAGDVAERVLVPLLDTSTPAEVTLADLDVGASWVAAVAVGPQGLGVEGGAARTVGVQANDQ